jgi:hypothetical protein
VTSIQSVRIPNDDVNALVLSNRMKSKQCTDIEHLGHNSGVEIAAEDVVRRYLHGLMQGRFPTKTALATGMGTSRAQLQASIRQGYLTVGQMNALAEAMGSSVWGVLKELAGLAEQMEKGRVKKLSGAELEHFIGGAERKPREKTQHILQGEIDEAAELSGGKLSRRAGPRVVEHDGRGVQRQPPPRPAVQPPRRPR